MLLASEIAALPIIIIDWPKNDMVKLTDVPVPLNRVRKACLFCCVARLKYLILSCLPLVTQQNQHTMRTLLNGTERSHLFSFSFLR